MKFILHIEIEVRKGLKFASPADAETFQESIRQAYLREKLGDDLKVTNVSLEILDEIRATVLKRPAQLEATYILLENYSGHIEEPPGITLQEYLEDGEDWAIHIDGTCYNPEEALNLAAIIAKKALKVLAA